MTIEEQGANDGTVLFALFICLLVSFLSFGDDVLARTTEMSF